MMDITCTKCGQHYPQIGFPYICKFCGGLYDFPSPIPFIPSKVDRDKPGIWRYDHTFGISSEIEPVTLGEGNTPLVWTHLLGRDIAFKCEYQNPSGSFKDRGSSVIATWLRARNIHEAVEDSSGNAGASFSAYAARAEINARIYIPESASGPKRRQIEAYGADLIQVPGNRKSASEMVRVAADKGITYASHAYLPFNLPGYATTSYEIFEQLGNKIPGAVVLPVGQGGLLLGISRGIDALRIAYSITKKPILVGVQARACAPLWAKFTKVNQDAETELDKQTIAEGVRVSKPVRQGAVLDAVSASHGAICAVEEDEIVPCRNRLAKAGFYVEPTSAIVLSALEKNIKNLPDPIVVILTGSGLNFKIYDQRIRDMADIQAFGKKLTKNLEKVIVGKRHPLELIVIGLLCQGHALIEDVPGVGKTVMARSLAKSLGCSFNRLQFTPDMLPSDVTGVSIFNQSKREFEFRPGPIFAQVVLVDEINRATPKTQAALLEAMEEKQVTVDGKTHPLPSPFMVLATQNPIEYEGTFPLPEAQLDRFLLRIRLGYPNPTDEIEIMDRQQLQSSNRISEISD